MQSVRNHKLVAGILAAIVVDAIATLATCVLLKPEWPYIVLGTLLLPLFFALDRSLSSRG